MKDLELNIYLAGRRIMMAGITAKEAVDNLTRNMRLIRYNELRKEKLILLNRIIER